ncbi:MAG: hypothetical protein MJZ35_04265 [Bacteroidaceae bacterium]|nr:hypothetical protein [Bacteroidaceae bacterium]
MRKFFAVILLLLSGLVCLTWALQPDKNQAKGKKRSSSSDQIVLLHADSMYFNQRINASAQFFIGNVKFEHNGAIMTCDSALYYKETKSFDAYGRVKMVQGDTLSLTCRKMFYDGNLQLAQARENVVLKHRKTTLTSESLDFDRILNVGQYFEGGMLVDEDNQLTSDTGYYHPDTRQAEFRHYVELINPLPPKERDYILQSHLLYYNTSTTLAHVVGPSTIDHESTHIYTENGYYTTQTKEGILLGHTSLLQHVYKELIGDSLHYDGLTHINTAYGHVEYVDKENKNMFFGNYGLYNDSTGYAEAADSAVCIDYSQRDTLYAHADTFKLYTYNIDTDSVYRVMHAYNRVRAYRVDMQCVCDSMVYNGQDSCATLYKDPIIWQDQQQILGEVIKAWVNDSTLDSVYVINQALMVEKLDTLEHYNQISSNEMHSYFRDGEVYQNRAEQNVYINYYPYDSDSLMIGMVHAESSRLRMDIENRKLQKIWMPATTGEMFPLDLTPPDKLYLTNFKTPDGGVAWFDGIRPKNKDDIFVWQAKSEEFQLKQDVLHEGPKQSLEDRMKQLQEKKLQSKK